MVSYPSRSYFRGLEGLPVLQPAPLIQRPALVDIPQPEPKQPPKDPPSLPARNHKLSIDSMLNGLPFYDQSLPTALRKALNHAGPSGIVLNMPEFIAAKAKAAQSHAFWKNNHSLHTEEDIGVDKAGKFYRRDTPILVVMHGGGILTPDRAEAACAEGLLDGSARYKEKEFEDLLKGNIYITNFPLYSIGKVKKGISDLPHQFGVVMPYEMATQPISGYHNKKQFLENPLVIARAASRLDYLEDYYEKAKAPDNDLGNWHPFEGRDTSIPCGRILFIYNTYMGLTGKMVLTSSGSFVGVTSKAHK